MRKVISLICVVLILSICFCGCQKAGAGISDESSSLSESLPQNTDAKNSDENSSSTEGLSNGNAPKESLTEKLIREIDGAYAEESKLPESSTTMGMVELADKYTKKWQQVADEYYNKIMEYDDIFTPNENYYSSDDFHSFVSNMKSNWEQYYQVQCENYLKTLQAIYSGGTIVGPLFANYKYKLQKEWTLQLVDICEQLDID